MVVISFEDVDDTVVVVVVVVILWALKALWELGINDPWDMVLLTPTKSGILEDGGSCEFLPYSMNWNYKIKIKQIVNKPSNIL